MKKVAILYSEYIPIMDAIKYYLEGIADVSCLNNTNFNSNEYDLIVSCGYKNSTDCECLISHHSLLPSFQCDYPEKETIDAGVKVTGITIYYKKSGRIIAQYPIFINNNMRLAELEQELEYLEQTLFPLVIKKIIINEQFEIQSLIKNTNSCSSHCGGCSSCHN